jgi:hypothetical protein
VGTESFAGHHGNQAVEVVDEGVSFVLCGPAERKSSFTI